MKPQDAESFPAEVARKLKTYVYRLIDPRNGETFYVGKGRGDRVFAHMRAEQSLEGDELDNKVKRIREIRVAGFEVAHVIHRHGLDDRTAFEVEAALIDAYPGLTNVAGGTGNNDYGTMHAKEIVSRYCAAPAVFEHRALLISVNRSATERSSLYEATRYAWKLDKAKAEQAEVVLATRQGEIVGAFVPRRWLRATKENFPEFSEAAPERFGFEGDEAPESMKRLYVGKRVPDEYRRPGAANPIKYTWGTGARRGNVLKSANETENQSREAAPIVIQSPGAPVVFQHRAVLINVNKSIDQRPSLYEATRYAWKLSRPMAEQVEVVLATRRGEIVGAFTPRRWLEATPKNFPGLSKAIPGRLGFEGEEAAKEIQHMYVGKRVPDVYRKQGAANPIKYTWRGRR